MEQNERRDLVAVIGNFIAMGHVENIAAMFRQDPRLYELTSDLLRDERFVVRVGLAVLFEELAATCPHQVCLAVPLLLPLLRDEVAFVRGESATLLGIIATPEALAGVSSLRQDPDPQVAEIAADILAEHSS